MSPASISPDHRAYVFVTRNVVAYLHSVVWKVAIVRQMLHSHMFDGEDAVNEVWKHGEKKSYRNIVGVYITQIGAELTEAGYTILEFFGDGMHFPKN